MPGPEPHRIAGDKGRGEKGQALDMVVMGVGQKNVELGVPPLILQMMAEHAQARPGIEDQDMAAAADFDAGRVAAIAQRLRPRRRDTAPHAPEPRSETILAPGLL